MIYELIVKESTLPRTDTFYSIPSGGSILDVFEFSFTSTQIQSDTFCSFESLRYLPECQIKFCGFEVCLSAQHDPQFQENRLSTCQEHIKKFGFLLLDQNYLLNLEP